MALQTSTSIPDKSARAQSGPIMKSASVWGAFVHTFSMLQTEQHDEHMSLNLEHCSNIKTRVKVRLGE